MPVFVALWVLLLGAISCFGQLPIQGDLIVSNSPEKVLEPGQLFASSLPVGSTRFLFHHQNMMGKALQADIVLRNSGVSGQSLSAVSAFGGPDLDEVFVGHQATKRYLSGFLSEERQSYLVAPFSETLVASRMIKPGMVLSGLFHFESQTEGLSLVFRLIDPAYPQLSALNNRDTSRAFKARHIVDAYEEKTVTFDVSQAVHQLALGAGPFKQDQFAQPLKGNYGVFYLLRINLINPGAQHRSTKVLLSPAGGAARVIGSLNGTFFETGLLVPTSKASVESIHELAMPPGSHKTLWLLTMPQAGSSYPVNIVFQTQIHGMIEPKERS